MAINNSINSPRPITVPQGGTAKTSFTAYSVICGGTTSTGILQNVSGVGTSNQILTSTGAASLPTWQTTAGGSLSLTAASTNLVCSPATITGTGTIDLASSPSVSGSWTVGTSFNIPDTTSSTTGVIFHNTSTPFIHTGIAESNSNIFLGLNAGNFTLTGTLNTGLGRIVLNAVTSGNHNSGLGTTCLSLLTTGTNNVAFIGGATSGLTSGSNNTTFGETAGINYTTESSNINIESNSVGASTSESNLLRIGHATGTAAGNISTAIICGITGKTSASGIGALVNSSNVLGTTTSSLRFKHNITDMADSSSRLMKLRPVTFLYNKEIEDATDETKYGLIAEEVAEIFPELVVWDEEDKPFTIRYNDMPAMLLNEIQKLNRCMDKLEAQRGTIH